MTVVRSGKELVGGYYNGKYLNSIHIGTEIGTDQIWGAPDPPSYLGITTGIVSTSFQHAAPAGTTYVVLDVFVLGNQVVNTVTYDGNAMSALGSQRVNNGGTSSGGWRYGIYLSTPADGNNKPVVITLGGFGSVQVYAISLTGVEEAGSTTKAYGQAPSNPGATMMVGPVSNEPGGMIVASFFATGSGQSRTISSPTGGTHRFTSPTGSHCYSAITATDTASFSAHVQEAFWPTDWAALATTFKPLNDPIRPAARPLRLVQTDSTMTTISVRASGDPVGIGALQGWNFYIDGVKDNTSVHLFPEYTFEGLIQGTFYDLTFTIVDLDDNETDPSPVLTASTLGSPGLPSADRNEIDSIVTNAMAANRLPGVLVSVRSPQGEYDKAYGESDIIWHEPIGLNDHFRMFSVTKSFTATAILQQVEAGNLSLTDTVDMYVEDIPNGDKITIQQLLMMRAGLQSYDQIPHIALGFALYPTSSFGEDDALNAIRASAAILFEPGTDYTYSNTNYVLLGFILEAVTGQDIRTVLGDVITAAGLTETSWPAGITLPEPFCHGYWIGLAGNQSARTQMNPSFLGAAGGLVTNIHDLRKWGEVMRDGTLLDPATHSMWLSTMSGVPWGLDLGPDEFGYGMGLIKFGEWYGHDGSYPGYECCTMWHPGSGTVIAVMANHQTPILSAFSTIFAQIADHLYPGSLDEGVTP